VSLSIVSAQQVLQHLELISVALGLLINLVSGDAANSKRLTAHSCTVTGGQLLDGNPGNSKRSAAAAAARAVVACPSATAVSGSSVQLLCTVMATLGRLLQRNKHAEGATNAAPAADAEMEDVVKPSYSAGADIGTPGTADRNSRAVPGATAAPSPFAHSGQAELLSNDDAGEVSIV